MQENKNTVTGFVRAYTSFYHKEVKTAADPSVPQCDNKSKCSIEDVKSCLRGPWYSSSSPVISHYFTLAILGLLVWGALWCLFGEEWSYQGRWFKLALVGVVAWSSGQVLEMLTMLPPLLAALLTGILARNLGFLDMHEYTEIDLFLRKFYPIIILGKGSLGWNLNFMKTNWVQIASLGTLPWMAEVCVVAFCANHFIHFPLIWGFLLGSIYASVSFAVIMPPVIRISSQSGSQRNWPQLIVTSGGIDTALSVGVFGLINSFLFYETDNDTYRYAKAGLALFAGVALGVAMGCFAGLIPNKRDPYVKELRIMLVVVGGLLANILTSKFGWGGTGGVAVLACNSTAATFWARDGWKLNNNPASTAYRVMWSGFEPILFAYTGTLFEISSSMSKLLFPGFAIMATCMLVRLTVTCLVCWDFNLKEKLFVCCAWIPKSIVPAVLCPIAIDTLLQKGLRNTPDYQHATNLMRLTVQLILVSTPLGFLLTNHVGPYLLRQIEKDCEKADPSSQGKSTVSQPEDRT